MRSRGAVALAEVLARRRGEQRRIATACGVAESTVSRWADGECMPAAKHQLRLDDSEGIPFAWWSQEAADPDSTGEHPSMPPTPSVPPHAA
jgi:transcriptional regulator with XRE-family HTH domain